MTSKTSASNIQTRYILLLVLLPFSAMAQENFTPNTDDVTPQAPVDNYILLASLLGIYFAYRFLKPTITPNQLNK